MRDREQCIAALKARDDVPALPQLGQAISDGLEFAGELEGNVEKAVDGIEDDETLMLVAEGLFHIGADPEGIAIRVLAAGEVMS